MSKLLPFQVALAALVSLSLPVRAETAPVAIAAYEKIGHALASDDLEGAHKAAGEFAAQAKVASNEPATATATKLVASTSLEAARAEFKTLSAQEIAAVKGKDGFYVVSCPMAKAEWVQTTKTISNPYLGKAMPTCGVIK